MAKNKNKKKRTSKPEATEQQTAATGGGMYALRETIESIVIAFVLAFLFRTFEAEAFVIPTGSMSPSLQGQHKDVSCSECGYRFRTTASSEGEDRQRLIARLSDPTLSWRDRESIQQNIQNSDIVAGMCPMCRQTMAMRPDLSLTIPDFVGQEDLSVEKSYPGDRILVNKYSYNGGTPDRWDVVVFKFPGDGEMNYIKRLVGLPNETLRIYQGDIYVSNEVTGGEFQIVRKPADKVLAMMHPVHDTDYESAKLYEAGWPLRWSSAQGWDVEASASGQTVEQRFVVNGGGSTEAPVWLSYQHFVPSDRDWAIVRQFDQTGEYPRTSKEKWQSRTQPELISDFNPYNAEILRGFLPASGWRVDPTQLGTEWVSDLAVRCNLDVKQAKGAVLLDLVEAGRHFTCSIDLKTGQATLSIEGADDFEASAQTSVKSAGEYELLFANVDDQMLLWVNEERVQFENATYGESEIGPREDLMPRTSDEDAGDLSPARIGAVNADLIVSRIELLRDIYYIAVNHEDSTISAQWSPQPYFTDYKNPRYADTLEDGTRIRALNDIRDLFRDPDTWSRFLTRESRDFSIGDDQLFVMGDNSTRSQDCRLWSKENPVKNAYPGGSYLDRRLLIGKAVCVFWPHSWGEIPGAERLPGFPNFGDMRLVR